MGRLKLQSATKAIQEELEDLVKLKGKKSENLQEAVPGLLKNIFVVMKTKKSVGAKKRIGGHSFVGVNMASIVNYIAPSMRFEEFPDHDTAQFSYIGGRMIKETRNLFEMQYWGDQLRYSFVSHLIDAFERHGINFFVDKYEQRGKDLKNLFVRIEECRIALAIFSTRYPESSWCMDELVKMKKLVEKRKIQVIPIFYKVRARDVRRQTGEFGDNFWKLAKASSGDEIKKWKEALECISDKMGLSLKDNRSESDFVKEIVKEVVRVIAAAGLDEEENHFEKKRRKDCNCPWELPDFKRIKTKKM